MAKKRERSPAQQWASERMGMKSALEKVRKQVLEIRLKHSVTRKQFGHLTDVIFHIDELLRYWKSNSEESKERFLRKGGKDES